jgi:hypothetical protein
MMILLSILLLVMFCVSSIPGLLVILLPAPQVFFASKVFALQFLLRTASTVKSWLTQQRENYRLYAFSVGVNIRKSSWYSSSLSSGLFGNYARYFSTLFYLHSSAESVTCKLKSPLCRRLWYGLYKN